VRTWSDAPVAAQRESGVRSNILNKGTRMRLADVYRRAFLPRFVSGPIPNAWKLVRPLEDVGAPVHIVRPVYYWISAKAEPLLGDFCREFILPRHATVRGGISTEDVLNWLSGKRCPWCQARRADLQARPACHMPLDGNIVAVVILHLCGRLDLH